MNTIHLTTDAIDITITCDNPHYSLGDSGFLKFLAALQDFHNVAPVQAVSVSRQDAADGKTYLATSVGLMGEAKGKKGKSVIGVMVADRDSVELPEAKALTPQQQKFHGDLLRQVDVLRVQWGLQTIEIKAV